MEFPLGSHVPCPTICMPCELSLFVSITIPLGKSKLAALELSVPEVVKDTDNSMESPTLR